MRLRAECCAISAETLGLHIGAKLYATLTSVTRGNLTHEGNWKVGWVHGPWIQAGSYNQTSRLVWKQLLWEGWADPGTKALDISVGKQVPGSISLLLDNCNPPSLNRFPGFCRYYFFDWCLVIIMFDCTYVDQYQIMMHLVQYSALLVVPAEMSEAKG